jgi:hypothetical protein
MLISGYAHDSCVKPTRDQLMSSLNNIDPVYRETFLFQNLINKLFFKARPENAKALKCLNFKLGPKMPRFKNK